MSKVVIIVVCYGKLNRKLNVEKILDTFPYSFNCMNVIRNLFYSAENVKLKFFVLVWFHKWLCLFIQSVCVSVTVTQSSGKKQHCI